MKEFVDKLISRLKEYRNFEDHDSLDRQCIDSAIEIVNKLAEEYNNGWISCSERLPEIKGEYLITLRDGEVTTAIYYKSENIWVDTIEEYYEYPCIAWQPLPLPYKAGD